MKILVTGCAGFIGFHLTRRLTELGHEVVGVDNLNEYYSPELKAARLGELGIDRSRICYGATLDSPSVSFRFIALDIQDPELYGTYLSGVKFDAVCHLAAQAGVRYSIENPEQYASSNLFGFFRILEYCRHNPVERFVFASSSSVYGNNNQIPYKEDDCTDNPVSFYGATKKANEVMAYSYSSLYGIPTIGLRFFTVYGPWGRPDMAPFIFTKAIIEQKPINVFNNGNLERDYTYIDDIIEGVCKVLLTDTATASPNFRIYNIGNSQPIGLKDFIAAIEQLTGRMADKNLLPMQQGDVLSTWADTTRLRADYGYSPSTPLPVGLAAFIDWYRKYYKVS